MQRVATILGFLLLLLMAGSVLGQEGTPTARKLDDFGKIGHCDLTARLDNLAIVLQSTPGAEGTIIFYGPGGASGSALENIKGYLINSRGIDPESIKTVYGGRNSDLKQPKIELWMVPKGAAQPEPEKHESVVETFRGLFDDDETGDDFGIYFEAEMGPGIGDTVDASFADILQQQQKHAIGYVVVYSGEDLTPGAWRRIGQQQIDHLKSFQLTSSHLKMIFGGYQKQTRVQLWVLPKNAPPPVPEAKELPAARTVKAGDFYEWNLNYERNQKVVVARLAEILRLDKTVRAFLVVRIAPPVSEAEASDAEPVVAVPQVLEEPLVEEPDPVDLAKLVEQWRVELTTTHKIASDRLIILFTTAPEFGSRVSLWIVPKGQPLPDPKDDEEEEPQVNADKP